MARTISKDKYLEALNSGGGVATGNSTGNTDPNQTTNPDQDYYSKLKSESYKSLLNSEIQASTARDQALKYTQNAINQSGFAGQGISESSRLGIMNNYQQALANAGQQYDNAILDISKQEKEYNDARENDDFESITTLMSNASTKEDLDKIYNAYSKGEGMNDRNSKQLQLLYQLYSTQLNDEPTALSNVSYNASSLNGSTYRNPETNAVSRISTDFQYEAREMTKSENLRKYQDGDTISLTNGNGLTITYRYNKETKKFTQITNVKNPTYAITYNKDVADNAIFN